MNIITQAIQFIKDGLAAGAAQVDGVFFYDESMNKYIVRFNAGIELDERPGIHCSDHTESKCYVVTAKKFNAINAYYRLYDIKALGLGEK